MGRSADQIRVGVETVDSTTIDQCEVRQIIGVKPVERRQGQIMDGEVLDGGNHRQCQPTQVLLGEGTRFLQIFQGKPEKKK